jgi:retinol dehydrogenase-13
MACPLSYTKDGFELQLGVNHLGHFLLTHLLLDLLKAAPSARIVNVSSNGHKMSDIIRNDLMSEKNYNRWTRYGQSKLANILFSRELAKKLQGTNVTVNSCHPGCLFLVFQRAIYHFQTFNISGAVKTELGRHINQFLLNFLILPLAGPFFKTPIEGAQTQIRLAVDPELEHVSGKYFADCVEAKTSKQAANDETAEWLYKKSVELVKL